MSIISRVPCTKVLSQKIQIFQKISFCVLQVSLLHFTNKIWQLYIFYNVRIVFESSLQLRIFKVAILKKLWQFWQKNASIMHVKRHSVGPVFTDRTLWSWAVWDRTFGHWNNGCYDIVVHKGAITADRTFVQAVRLFWIKLAHRTFVHERSTMQGAINVCTKVLSKTGKR